jgi:Fis family transcriptional regulator
MDSSNPPVKPLHHAVSDCLEEYFRALNGHVPCNLYTVVMNQVEPPLLRSALKYCGGNQSRAADLLGINRATLRKKLGQYQIVAQAVAGPR